MDSPKSSEGSARLYSRGWANGDANAGRRKFRDWEVLVLGDLGGFGTIYSQSPEYRTYHTVGALGSLSVDATTASTGVVGARVHDVKLGQGNMFVEKEE